MPLSGFINHVTLKANLSPEQCPHGKQGRTCNSLFTFQSVDKMFRAFEALVWICENINAVKGDTSEKEDNVQYNADHGDE